MHPLVPRLLRKHDYSNNLDIFFSFYKNLFDCELNNGWHLHSHKQESLGQEEAVGVQLRDGAARNDCCSAADRRRETR